MKDIFSKKNIITAGSVVSFFLLILFIGTWWIGIGFVGISLVYVGWVLYETNWCEPGSCNGMFFIPAIFGIFIGWLFISAGS